MNIRLRKNTPGWWSFIRKLKQTFLLTDSSSARLSSVLPAVSSLLSIMRNINWQTGDFYFLTFASLWDVMRCQYEGIDSLISPSCITMWNIKTTTLIIWIFIARVYQWIFWIWHRPGIILWLHIWSEIENIYNHQPQSLSIFLLTNICGPQIEINQDLQAGLG